MTCVAMATSMGGRVRMPMYTLTICLLSIGLVLARDGPAAKGRTPLMGWNTWCTQNTCGVDWCTSAEVLDVATAIKQSGMQAAGYDHINLV